MIELNLKNIILKSMIAISVPLATISILHNNYTTLISSFVLVLALLLPLTKIIKRIRPYPILIPKEHANLPNIILITFSILLTAYLLYNYGYIHLH